MGAIYAAGLAASTDLRTAVRLNLTVNHYPPLPAEFVDLVIEAIEAEEDDEPHRLIILPPDLNPLPRSATPHEDGWAIPAAVLLDITHSWAFVRGDDHE